MGKQARTDKDWLLGVVLIGLALEAFLEMDGAFVVSLWLAFGLYVCMEFVDFIAGASPWIEQQLNRLPDVETTSAPMDYRQRDAYLALSRKDLRELKRVIETYDVDPFAIFPVKPKSAKAKTLYGCAKAENYTEAIEYFNAWRRGKSERHLAGH